MFGIGLGFVGRAVPFEPWDGERAPGQLPVGSVAGTRILTRTRRGPIVAPLDIREASDDASVAPPYPS